MSITLDDVAVRRGETQVLNGFTGTFEPGTVTALIGGDGAGKSTLLRALAGRLRFSPTQQTPATNAQEVGYQPADSGVWRNLTVVENIKFTSGVYGLNRAEALERSEQLLARAGLDHARHRVAGRLSGGMRQKLGFILATLHQPRLVLLDEPTTGVDPVSRAELWTLIASAATEGATVVFATTYLDEAERAHQLFFLSDGALLASGEPHTVLEQTPGTIWSMPASNLVHDQHPHSWRRGRTTYAWTPAPIAPLDGAEAVTPDMENAAIAQLLAQETQQAGIPLKLPEPVQSTSPHQSHHLIRAESIERRFGNFTALNDVSLDVKPGEVVGLLGGNGAGKTTLMRIILGLETPTSGTVRLFGQQPSLHTRRRLGYVAQGLGLYPSLSAAENLEFAASVHKLTAPARARETARTFGATPVGRLPLGAQRTLAYLMACLHRPELLILDEPTSGMDALSRARLWRHLRDSAETGIGILITTHYMQEAAQCDRLVILTAGDVTATGTSESIAGTTTSLVITTQDWQQAFSLLRSAGLPTALDGKTLRLPGVSRQDADEALEHLAGRYETTEAVSTLEETMALTTDTFQMLRPTGAQLDLRTTTSTP